MNSGATSGSGGGMLRGRRLRIFGFLATLWMAAVLLRLWEFQVLQAERLADSAKRQQERSFEIAGRRGSIYDRNGVELAMSTPVESIGAFPDKISDPALAASLLAKELDIDPVQLERKLRREGFQWVKRLAEPGETKRVRKLNLLGLHFEKENKRYFPKGRVAAHVLGSVGIDHQGMAGLELRFDKILTGRPGRRLVQFDSLGKRYASEIVEAPIPGSNLYLTIEEGIQASAEQALAQAALSSGARAGSIVVMDPDNGDLLALANWPGFDPNAKVRTKGDLALRRNFAIGHLYEPGSTFKIITVAAALEERLTTPEEVIDCQRGAIYVGRRRIRDHKRFGLLTVSDVVAQSSNVGAIKLAQRLGAARLYKYVRMFGFGEKSGIELPGETAGLVHPLSEWGEGSVASVAIGQEIGVTAVQVAQAVAVIANGGRLVKAHVVDSIRDPAGRIRRFEAGPQRRVIRAETAAMMRAMLERTVRSGTGRLARTPGYRVAGKTGTAQVADLVRGGYEPGHYIASFVGFGPVNDAAIVAVIVLDWPVGDYYGGQVAAPVFPLVAASALRFRDVPPSEPLSPQPEAARETPGELLADFAAPVDDSDEPPATSLATPDGAILVTGFGTWPSGSEKPDPPAPGAGRSARPVALRVTSRVAPEFRGMSVRAAFERAWELGLAIEPLGSGVAIRQFPTAGTPLTRGARIEVEFGRRLAKAAVSR